MYHQQKEKNNHNKKYINQCRKAQIKDQKPPKDK